MYKKATIAYNNRERAEQIRADLEKREKDLSSRIETLDTNAGVEREIRDRYGLAKEGEEIVIIVADPAHAKVQGGGQGATVSWWARFKAWW